jgi:enoyl-CoA hydratase/carnithine racemase
MTALISPPFEAIQFDIDDAGIAWLELNRPEAANARNQQMRLELLSVYDLLARDPGARVLVLTAAGTRFFCAGMDLKESGGSETPLERRQRLQSGRDIEALASLPIPTIAAINGYALGGGLEMALACDLRIAAAEAQLGLPEITHGLIPGGGATQRLPQLIGPGRAYEMLYLGERVDGRTARDIGLVNRCVPLSELQTSTRILAEKIAQASPTALRLLKEAIRNGLELAPDAARRIELDLLLTLMAERAAE